MFSLNSIFLQILRTPLFIVNNLFLQVIALICGLIVIVLMLMTLTSTDWLLSAGWRQGLFSHCIAPNAPTPLPFNVPNNGPDCYPTREVGTYRGFFLFITPIDFVLTGLKFQTYRPTCFACRIHQGGRSVVYSNTGH